MRAKIMVSSCRIKEERMESRDMTSLVVKLSFSSIVVAVVLVVEDVTANEDLHRGSCLFLFVVAASSPINDVADGELLPPERVDDDSGK